MTDTAGIGHNSIVDIGKLRALVERIERLEDDKSAIGEDIKEVYAEAKGSGYDTKALRKIVALRRMDEAKRRDLAEMVALYGEALGLTGVLA